MHVGYKAARREDVGMWGEHQHGCGVNAEGREVARRKMDVKEGEDAPGYTSAWCAARGARRLFDGDEERSGVQAQEARRSSEGSPRGRGQHFGSYVTAGF